MVRGCKLKHKNDKIKAVSKKKQSREQKASAKEFERATAWLRSQGIKSKLAIFSILMVIVEDYHLLSQKQFCSFVGINFFVTLQTTML